MLGRKVEFIESYIKIGNSDYQWNDNHGELIRCKDCKYHGNINEDYCVCLEQETNMDFFCRYGERKQRNNREE